MQTPHNPATEEVIETFELFSKAQVREALDDARHAFLSWRNTSFAERSALLHHVAAYLREHEAHLAQIATLEMGKPIAEAEAEQWHAETCAHR